MNSSVFYLFIYYFVLDIEADRSFLTANGCYQGKCQWYLLSSSLLKNRLSLQPWPEIFSIYKSKFLLVFDFLPGKLPFIFNIMDFVDWLLSCQTTQNLDVLGN